MTSLAIPEVMSSCGRDLDLARRRLQQKGDLFNQGGMWKLRWHEDKIGPDGERMRGWSRAVHIGPHIALIGQMRRPVCKPICTLIGRAMSAR